MFDSKYILSHASFPLYGFYSSASFIDLTENEMEDSTGELICIMRRKVKVEIEPLSTRPQKEWCL